MKYTGNLFAVICISACLAVPASAAQVTIADVPSYIWYHGCGPTALGMIIGYWDAQGYPNLISGSNDWYTNQQAIKNAIASPGHIRDYVSTPDRVASPSDPYHVDDSLADFNNCSRDPNAYGWSLFSKQDDGLDLYAAYRGYGLATASNMVYYTDTFWTSFIAQIGAGRPVQLLVDTNGDGATDHFVTAIGYDDTPGARKYAAYNTYDHSIHWYDFQMRASGRIYGIYGGTFFDPGPIPGDANGDGKVDSTDMAIWQANYDPVGANPNSFATGDWNGDGYVDSADLAIWQTAYNSLGMSSFLIVEGSMAPVPEPGTLSLGALALVGFAAAIEVRRRL